MRCWGRGAQNQENPGPFRSTLTPLPNLPSFQKHPGLRDRTGTSPYLDILAELGV